MLFESKICAVFIEKILPQYTIVPFPAYKVESKITKRELTKKTNGSQIIFFYSADVPEFGSLALDYSQN